MGIGWVYIVLVLKVKNLNKNESLKVYFLLEKVIF